MKKSAAVWTSVCCLAAVLMLCGCATGGKGPTDEEQIKGLVEGWKAAMVAQDIEKIMVAFSEKFTHYEAPDKAAMKDFIQSAIDMGYLEDAEINLDEMQVTIEGTTATVYPLSLSSAAGEVTLELTLTKEESGWHITGMDIEGL